MSRRIQLLCAWCGPGLVVTALIGLLIGRIFPFPPAANYSLDQTVEFYSSNPTMLRFGLMLTSVGLSLIGPLVAVITLQMMRMESGRPPILSLLQAIAGAVTWVMLMVPIMIMNVAAFRPDRNPEVTQALTDMGWILFLTPVAPFLIQNFCIGGAILGDRSATPVLPRWPDMGTSTPACSSYRHCWPTSSSPGHSPGKASFVFYLGWVVMALGR